MMLTAPPTFSQDTVFSTAELRTEIDAGLVIALEDAGQSELLADLQARLEWETITEGGRRFGFVLGGRAERDPHRTAWGGSAGECPEGQADCRTTTSGDVVRGLTSGLYASASAQQPNDIRSSLEDAYGFVHFGYGELRLGYGDGAARMDAVAPPTAFRLARADNGRVGLSELSNARTFNYASGQSPKIAFRSIALGQARSVGSFRANLSFTPEVSGCGVDVCDFDGAPAGVAVARVENVVEIAGYYELHRGETEMAFSFSHSRGENVEPDAVFRNLRVSDVGVRLDRGAWSAGLRWLNSNNASQGDHEAIAASVALENGDWLYALEWSGFGDNTVHSDGSTWQVGASKLLGDHWLAGFGVQQSTRDVARITPSGRRELEQDSTTFFVELGWRY